MQKCDNCGERSINVDNGPYPADSQRLPGGCVLRGGLYPIRAHKKLICGRCALRYGHCIVGDRCDYLSEALDITRCAGCDTKLHCALCATYFVQVMQMQCPICYHGRDPDRAPEWMHERITWANSKKEPGHHKTQ